MTLTMKSRLEPDQIQLLLSRRVRPQCPPLNLLLLLPTSIVTIDATHSLILY